MMAEQDAGAVADKVLDEAARFFGEHRHDDGMSHTFGYFTDHPVARLNRRRLILSLDEIARQVPAGSALLDMGSGGGVFTAAFSLSGYRTAGVDLSPDEIDRARVFAERLEVSPALFAGDLQKDDWIPAVEAALGGHPTILFYGYCLHHLPAVEDHLRMMGEWLPEGSVIVVNEENPRSPLWFVKNAVRSVIQRDTKDEAQRGYRAWSRMLGSAGFVPAGALRGTDVLPGVPARFAWSQVFSHRKSPSTVRRGR